jgi:hypothetical protein
MFVCCVCCVLSSRGLCDKPITRPRRVLPTVPRRCVWSRNLVWRGGHSPHWTAQPGNKLDCLLLLYMQSTFNFTTHRHSFKLKQLLRTATYAAEESEAS